NLDAVDTPAAMPPRAVPSRKRRREMLMVASPSSDQRSAQDGAGQSSSTCSVGLGSLKDLRGARRLECPQHISISRIEDGNSAQTIAHIDLRAILGHLHRRGGCSGQPEFELIDDFASGQVEDLQLTRIPKETSTIRVNECLAGEGRDPCYGEVG